MKHTPYAQVQPPWVAFLYGMWQPIKFVLYIMWWIFWIVVVGILWGIILSMLPPSSKSMNNR